jgi:hypothetical protein
MTEDAKSMTTEEIWIEIGFLKNKLLAVYGKDCAPSCDYLSDWKRLQQLKAEYKARG